MAIKSIISSKTVSVPESYSHKENKRKGAGSGETRLYIGQQNEETDLFINFDDDYITLANKKKYSTCKNPFVLVKDNLLKYHRDVKKYYSSEEFSDTNANLLELYDKRLQDIQSLNEMTRFVVFNQSGETDKSRIYIGSVDKSWELVRRIALPKISIIRIDKIFNSSNEEIQYVLSVHIKDELNTDDNNWKQHNFMEDVEKKVEDEIDNNGTLSETEKTELRLARRGQGKFRKQVIDLMGSCVFTGISEPNLLRASHCIPWSECQTSSDRLDGYNGLLLTPTYDVLFDQGYITFDDDGKLIIADCLNIEIAKSLNLIEHKQYLTEEMRLDMRARFIRYHRLYVFKGKGGYAE